MENGKKQGFVGAFVVLYSSLLGGWAPSGCTPLKFNSNFAPKKIGRAPKGKDPFFLLTSP